MSKFVKAPTEENGGLVSVWEVYDKNQEIAKLESKIDELEKEVQVWKGIARYMAKVIKDWRNGKVERSPLLEACVVKRD